MKSTLLFYIAIFMRRIHYFILIFGVIAALSVTVAKILPAVYLASSGLLIEGSQIPSQLAAPTVITAAAEELQIIEQRLMTRVNLLSIARDLNVFGDMGTMSADEIVTGMRDQTTIRRSTGNGQATLMNISFEADTGPVAANVVNRYVTIILQDNAEVRADRAGKTLEFFEVEVERLGNELEKQNAAILAFNNENSDALPQTLNYRLTQQSTLQARLATTERDMDLLREQKRKLIEIFDATGTVGPVANANLTPEQQKLAQLEDQLRTALAVYTPENPKVRILQAQVAQQQSVVNTQSGASQTGPITQSSMLDIQLADIAARLDVFKQQRELVLDQLATLEDSIDRTPAVTIALASYDRDYQNIQAQYNRAVNGLSQAATGERIELLAKGRRISVIDPATVPNEPARPNRMLIAVGGSLFGAMLGFVVIIGLEFLNNSIRRATDIANHLGITPIATVPYIRTPVEMVFRRAGFVAAFIILVVGLPAALFAIHTYYLPLDLIYDQIATKVSDLL